MSAPYYTNHVPVTCISRQHTCETEVSDFQVRFELTQARSALFQFGVRNSNLAGSSSGTSTIGDAQDVRLASDVSHVRCVHVHVRRVPCPSPRTGPGACVRTTPVLSSRPRLDYCNSLETSPCRSSPPGWTASAVTSAESRDPVTSTGPRDHHLHSTTSVTDAIKIDRHQRLHHKSATSSRGPSWPITWHANELKPTYRCSFSSSISQTHVGLSL